MTRKDTPEYINKVVRGHIERMYEDIAEDIADEDGVISTEASVIVRRHLDLINFHKFKVFAEQECTFEE
jgi:hypothetical protein